MLKRLNDINNLPSKDKEGVLFAHDGLLIDAKTRLAYLKKSPTIARLPLFDSSLIFWR